MTELEEKELIVSALDGLTLALDSLNDIDSPSCEIQQLTAKICYAFDRLLEYHNK